jgi:protein involved in polysaccharide export with SLBB domain
MLFLWTGGVWAQEVYRLEPHDQIEVWTSVEPSLRRTATIGPDGWLSLPLAGHLKAAGLTAPELEKELEKKLQGFFKEPLELTIMLQPITERTETIYVTGEVATPGSYPYRTGNLVLHGVSLAGGLYRSALTTSDEDREIEVGGEVKRQQEQLGALTARIARITAEMNGTDMVVDGSVSEEDMARERRILEARRTDHSARVKANEEAVALRRRAADSLREQVNTLDRRIEIAQQRYEAVSKLVTQGFANEAQQLELEGTITELRGTQHELQRDIATADLELAAELSTFAALDGDRGTQLTVELRDAQGEQQALRSSLSDNQRILRLYRASAAASVEAPQRTVVYSIVRTVNGQPVQLDASELTALEPGDLLRVSYVEDGPVPEASSTSSIEHLSGQETGIE